MQRSQRFVTLWKGTRKEARFFADALTEHLQHGSESSDCGREVDGEELLFVLP